ncbi:MAG TPA: hypothetical protein VF223_13055, partial [Trebonia sp.]
MADNFFDDQLLRRGLVPSRPVAEIRTGIAPGAFFHGTDPRTALDLATAHTNRVGLMVSQDPSLALGQGGRGALVEINP